MENFELIEKYAAGQLEGSEKDAFESQLQTDTSLQSDVALQKQIIEGVKRARISELKAMLNHVPVTGAMQSGSSAGQIITGAVTVGAIVTSVLFYYKPWHKEIVAPVIEKQIPGVEKNDKTEITTADPKDDKTSSSTSEPEKEVKKAL